MLINEPTVVQNDAIRFIIRVFDNGQPLDLTSVETASLANIRLDRKTVVTPGTKIGTNTVQFDLGTEETKVPGRVEATAQFYDEDGRVSTIAFTYRVVKDPTGEGYIPTERDQTLIEIVLSDGPLVIQQAQDAAEYATAQGDYAKQVADENKTRWLTAVNTYADIATTYPNPQLGDTVQTIDDSKIYRWDGTQWVWTQQYNANAITDVQNKIGILTGVVNLRNYIRYGRIDLPTDFFHNINFTLYRDVDGVIKHNFDVSNITNGYSVFYVSETGANGNDGRSESTPWKSLNYAIDAIEADPTVTSAKIVILSNYLSRSNAQINRKTLTKNYCIEPKTGISILATSEVSLTWTLDGGSYKATRSTVGEVFDNKYKIEYNLPTKYKKVTSKSECDATKGSWYTDGTYVWVNTLDSRTPDSDIFVCLNVIPLAPIVNADVKVIFRNLVILNGSEASALNIYSLGNMGHLILDNVKMLCGSLCTENVLTVKGIKYTWCFNSLAAYGGKDGFNYHTYLPESGGNTFVFEYKCVSFDNGLASVNSTNNATTCHDGIRILRVGCIGYNVKGPVLADVNGCYSINYDCVMYDSKINTGYSTKVAYYFDDAPSSLIAAPNGKAYLINCQGGGDVNYSISGDTSFKNGKINVLNFIGQKFPSDLVFSYIA